MDASHAAPPSAPPPRPTIVTAERPEPLPEPPRPLRERIRDGAGELTFRARRAFEEAVEDLRRRDRFFRYKAAIVAAWVLLSLVGIRVATFGPDDPASNRIGAYVALTRTSLGWGLLLHNRSDEPWTEVRVEIPGGWVHERERIEPDEKVVLGAGQFRREGRPAPAELTIEKVRIRTDQGSASPRVVR